MFGPSDGNNNSGGVDPVRQAMANRNLGFNPPDLPEGAGVYEIDRVWTRVSSGKKAGMPLFCARLKCVEHTNPANVGQMFGWINGLAGRPLNIILEVQTKFLVLPFGEEAKKQIASPACDDAIIAAHTEGYKTLVETQAFAGQPLKGKRLRVNGVKSDKVDAKGKHYINYYFDCA